MSRGVGVTETIRSGVPEWTLEAFAGLSLLGDLLVIVPVLGLLYIVDVGQSLFRDDREGPLCSTQTALLIAAVFGGLALVVLLKATFALPRPPAAWHALEPSEHGFPSGHTMAATVFWGALVLWSSIGRRSSRFAVSSAVVVLVALSRLALGVHYLVDVLASIAFGVVYLGGIAWLARERPLRAFGVAVAVAVVAVAVTGGSSRALLALVGTVGGGSGWWLLERPPVRQRLVSTVGPLLR
ncbi:phosphatase PAP2 family protein [Natronorubrum sulfidifaciens]|uniref:PA-phosphatase-like phosphoesterase n=1 Tax=Natronorubrum sulfidifaciens JCM 14089 TaxID=1230460 RepID=L9W797_9EURY|nr:phosphatase PAP2 family protein [Natronorubrum sulfidifaciens]ELY45365.1 PA-phosphatase-like phosphoesterase [Natronorubrum sulfidifaciens JCM 14089]